MKLTSTFGFSATLVIALTLALVATPQARATNCATEWRNGFPDPALAGGAVSCNEFRPLATTLPADLRIFTPSSFSLTETDKTQLEVIAEALKYSVGKYRAFGRVPRISVVRHDRANFRDAAAFGYAFVEFFNLDTEACPVFIYPLSTVLPKAHLQQVVAHEIFHCVQKYNFKDQTATAVSASGNGAWWFEGLAQYFSNVVYPSADFEYTSRFPAPDQTVPFFEQPNAYSSESFWQSYGNLIDTQLFGAQRLMPTSGAPDIATTANRLPRISEGLHEYAKQISMGKVRDSAGPMAPYRMDLEAHAATNDAHQEINLSFFDFVVGAYEITLPKGSVWNIRATLPSGAKASMKKAEDEIWLPMGSTSLSITSTCDQDRKIHVVATRASDQQSMNTARLILDRRDNQDCDCTAPGQPPQLDSCMIGTWQLDHSTVPQFWNRLAPQIEFLGSSGGFQVTLSAGNVGTLSASGWRMRARKAMGHNIVMTFTHDTNGTAQFQYSAHAGKLCLRPTAVNVSIVKTIDINGQTKTINDGLPFNASSSTVTYTCAPDHFLLQEIVSSPGGRHLINYVFRKL